jgi:mRNA-degrading endonuclease toxin of MazEF toxin-antitoxin module
MQPKRGDVVRRSDPFKLGEDSQRPWLILTNESHPFGDEQYGAVANSTEEYGNSIPVQSDVWKAGGVPRESFVSPWAVHSPRIEDLVAWQGRVTTEFVDHAVDRLETYLRGR